MRKHLIIVLFFVLTACEKANFDTAHQAYENGDYDKALKILLPLAEADDAKAQNNLGYMYLNGIGVEKDYAKAHKWYYRTLWKRPKRVDTPTRGRQLPLPRYRLILPFD